MTQAWPLLEALIEVLLWLIPHEHNKNLAIKAKANS